MDKISPERRSANMAKIRSQDTKPELVVRKMAHALGYRFRLHRKDLPGRPDLVFASRRAVIFVHGCFWHQHPEDSCKDARLPKTRLDYWLPKLARNTERDGTSNAALAAAGWRVLTIWDCETRDLAALAERIQTFLGPNPPEA
jgi:DNA mismatch endonuclease (patch repair protein)